MRLPLRRKILLYSSSLLIVLIVTMLVYVSFQAERFVDERIANDIQQGRERILQAERERIQALRLSALLVAELPILKATIIDTNTRTVLDTLGEYERQIPYVDMFMFLNESGNVVTRTDTTEITSQKTNIDDGVLTTVSGTYHVAKVP